MQETEDIDKLKNEIKLVEDKKMTEHINAKVSTVSQIPSFKHYEPNKGNLWQLN